MLYITLKNVVFCAVNLPIGRSEIYRKKAMFETRVFEKLLPCNKTRVLDAFQVKLRFDIPSKLASSYRI